MNKYRGIYRICMPVDNKGITTRNEDDTYIRCKANVQIFRFNYDTLAIQFNSIGYKNNRIKELTDIGVQLTNFISGDDESVYLFSESDLNKVAEILQPIIRGKNKSPKSGQWKRELTDEQKEMLRQRMINMRKNKVIE